MGASRRKFLQASALAATGVTLASGRASAAPALASPSVRIADVGSNFEREPLRRPFGFKGGYMSEIWQTAALAVGSSGARRIGLGTQSVLWSDARVFAAHSESGGNALMYAITERALALAVD